eukprot:EG_transcript_26493
MGGDVSSLLKEIDDHKGSVDKLVNELFDKVDTDKSGYIEGQEYTQFLNDVTDYMMGDFKKMGQTHDRKVLHRWVKEWLDPNGDGRISRRELKANIKRVLDAGEK